MEERKDITPLYPEIRIDSFFGGEQAYTLYFSTTVRRLQSDGRWYLLKVAQTHQTSMAKEIKPALYDLQKRIFHFNKFAYKMLHTFKFDSEGKKVSWVLDTDQQEERERMKNYIV